MGVQRVWIEGSRPPIDGVIRLTGDEARHALRVKRVGVGDRLELLDGSGFVAAGTVEGASTPGGGGPWLDVRVLSAGIAPPATPRLEVCSATPKGPRAAELVEQLSQVGAAAWRPLITERGVVDPGDTKVDRLRRIAHESAKQCGRPWVMEIGDPITLAAAVAVGGGYDGTIVVADASGDRYDTGVSRANIRLLIGPEGGWSDAERTAIAAAPGVVLARFGPHVMRIETAAVAGAAIVVGGAC